MKKAVVVNLLALFFLASASAFGAAGEKTKVEGMINTRGGETLVVQTADAEVTVVLTDDTVTKDDKGLFGLQKQRLSSAVLIPGLKVSVDGVTDDQGRVVAKTITVDGDDLESSEMIQAGLHPTAEQVATNVQHIEQNKAGVASNKAAIASNKENIETNQQNIAANQQRIAANLSSIESHTARFMALTDFDQKGQATVKFKVGSSKISSTDQAALKTLAQSAANQKGYIVEVIGYADSTGDAAMNTTLSEARAKAVVTYLVQQGGIPIRHIVAPGAMGEYGNAAPNETKAGRAENRKVDVKVLVNKGLAGGM